jgi:hypothetical protein
MAVSTPSEKEQIAAQQDDVLRIRRSFSDAYAAIMGTQTAKDFSAYTFEEALDQQLERIEGKSTKIRPNLLDRVNKIKTELLKAVEDTKAQPPENFREPEEDDVNKELNAEEQAEYDQWAAEESQASNE